MYRGDAGELPVLRPRDLTVRWGKSWRWLRRPAQANPPCWPSQGLLDRPDDGLVLIEGRDAGSLTDAASTASPPGYDAGLSISFIICWENSPPS